MLDDRSAIEHHKYSQRLTELERRSAAAQQRQQKKKPPKMHVGNKIRGIKIKRYVSNGERVLKLVVLFSAILLFMLYIISPLSQIFIQDGLFGAFILLVINSLNKLFAKILK